jgi:hypothetical protein
MKNANIFVDVDLTLIDANGKLLAGAREASQRLTDKGCALFLWSTNRGDNRPKTSRVSVIFPQLPLLDSRVPRRLGNPRFHHFRQLFGKPLLHRFRDVI